MKMRLVPVTSADIEWLRQQRNRPELYKYFRQDREITPQEQKQWWASVTPQKQALFFAELDKKRVGYVGFNPIHRYSQAAEFGIFILPEYKGLGYGERALRLLLEFGFDYLGLRTIYSDCLEYPGESSRFAFYEKQGFVAHAKEVQTRTYQKQGRTIPAIKFYMSAEMWESLKNGHKEKAGLGAGNVGVAVGQAAKDGIRVPTSQSQF